MEPLEFLIEYFRGERLTGLVLVPLGLLALGFSLYLWRAHAGAFMWGMVAPLVLVGLGFSLGGVGLAIKSTRDIDRLRALYQESPTQLVEVERPRMARVNANWPRLKRTWAVIIIASLGLLFFVEVAWVEGAALVLLLVAGGLMTLDTLAERRAEVYTAGLEQLASSR
ncbi:MAG: hypothetical protein R3A51_22970 [Nannocystaceae bacterium]|nr:hypothetical protein [Myxococcales bacterium]